MSKIFLWWLDQPQTESVFNLKELDTLPEYLQRSLNERFGRAGRGRLWVDHIEFSKPENELIAVEPWPDNDLARELGADSGGIAIREEHLPHISNWGGVVTDLKLNLHN